MTPHRGEGRRLLILTVSVAAAGASFPFSSPRSFILEAPSDILPSHLPTNPELFSMSLGYVLHDSHSSAQMTRGKERERGGDERSEIVRKVEGRP